MPSYQHILVGLDLSPESRQVVDRVAELYANNASDRPQITLMHVQEPLSFAYGGDIPMDLSDVQNQLEEQARSRLAEHGNTLSVAADQQRVIVGQPAHELHRYAEENQVDLIVVGSHGRHGLALLLGSTANGVIHGAGCDVLAVRIREEN
ncbi:universal stress protein [Porticoccus sp. W117]|uniref:universal stress protein n=1 Tax=Porticoccus sp. W117 TaxID=3054777 RepID=UPI0025961D9B|nr:universal stress protein [Porticoccus sp. W117]MDM3870332.1 universal stress protein [Porticoccus sp. W117]